MYKLWIYHATKNPKIITDDQFEAMQAEGWADSPARFVKLESLGIDKDDKIGAQTALDMIDGINESINQALSINSMGKQQLENYALKHFNVDIDRRKNIKDLRKEVKKLAGA